MYDLGVLVKRFAASHGIETEVATIMDSHQEYAYFESLVRRTNGARIETPTS
jgi:hypothetical protein